ncbi:hypothetical protein ARMSODRAFT_1022510 [Armillaria solidipes]|uniref:Uncharacterized protein n=1 Tax=Armillaria solidipes TaxID=1076256 RepID=A0A2H3BPT2_9AGAR|nr:hypothetical protein ARMSODRAFT_1022510 [Armillaria solidipes]
MAGEPIVGYYDLNMAPTKFVKGGYNGEFLKSGEKRRRKKRSKKIPITCSSSPIALSSPKASKAMCTAIHLEQSPVPAHATEIVPDSEPEGAICPLLDPLELMACDMDLTCFNPGVSTRYLRMGLKSAREAVEKLEQLADWMETADLMQWSSAVKAHQAVWAGWKEFQDRQTSTQHSKSDDI